MNGLTLEVLQVVIEAQTKPIRDELARLQTKINQSTNQITKKTEKIKSSFSKLSRFIASIALGAGLSKFAVNATNMAKNVEAATQQITMFLGENAQAFMRWGKQNALTLNMSQSDFLKFGSIYSNLLSSFISSTSGIASQTTNLLKASSIIASGTGRTMEDVMERIRSGLLGNTEAIEDLGINVNVAMLESTDAFKRFAGDNSWNQLDFQTQQQIRLFAILEQTSKKFGDSILNNTNSSLAQLTAILKDIALNIGNALLPVLNAILPPIIAFANVVRTATSYLATFMSLLFGKKKSSSGFKDLKNDANGASSAIGGINNQLGNTANNAKKTAKELDNLLGFDQITKIQDETSNSNNGSGGANVGSGIGGGIEWGDSFEEPDTTGVQKAVDKVKSAINDLHSFLDNSIAFIQKHKVEIITALSGLMTWLVTFFGYKWLVSGGLKKAIEKAMNIPGVRFLTKSFETLFSSIPTSLNNTFKKIITAITNSKLFSYIQKVFSPIKSGLSTLISKIGVFASGIIDSVMQLPVIGPILQTISGFISSLVSWLGTLSSSISSVLGVIVASPALLATVIALIVGAITELWLTNDDFRNNLIEAWENIKITLQNVWENVIKPIFDTFVEICMNVWENGIKPLWDRWVEFVEVIIGIVTDLWNNISPILNLILEVLGPIFKNVLSVLSTVFSATFNTVLNTIGVCLSIATGILEGFFSSVDEVFGGIKKIFNGIIDFITGIFTGDWSRAWNGVKDIFSGIFSSLSGLIKAPLNAVIGIVNGAISSINRIGFDIPSWVPGIGGKSFSINIPKMQYLAQGGIVNGATPAIIGEAGTEAVIPLKRNTQGIEMIANRLLEKMGGQQQTGDIYLTITLENGDVLTRYIIKNYNQLMQSTGGKGGFIW